VLQTAALQLTVDKVEVLQRAEAAEVPRATVCNPAATIEAEMLQRSQSAEKLHAVIRHEEAINAEVLQA
jgi:hypothetical protein